MASKVVAAQWIRNWLAGRRQRVCINQTISSWTPVTSGVPHGSVLGPLLFLIYINDLDNGIVSKISKFADDTKLCHSSRHPDEVLELQKDLNRLVDWANIWLMNFNIGHNNIQQQHIGHNNIQHNYTMANQQLIITEVQRNLGITITRDHKWQKQNEKSCKTANRIQGFIARNFNYKSTELMIPLYKSIVRPHLEYVVPFWSPHLRWNIDKMERVQRKPAKMIRGIRNLVYQQWLKDLELISPVQRRLREKVIEVFKYLNRFNNVCPIGLFNYDFNDRTRNNGKKWIVKRFNTSVAQHFFPINITTTCNGPPYDVVNSGTVNKFKNSLDARWEGNPPDVQVNW